LIDSIPILIRRSRLAGGLTLVALAAGPTLAVAGAATGTNPASTALAPVSKQARPAAGGGGGLGNSGVAAGARGAPATPAGGTPAAGTPTTTYTPPATSQTGTPATGLGASTPTASAAANPPSRRASSSTSTAAIALAILAGLLALAAAAWGIARQQAYEPRWSASLRHDIAEAGYRASATWAEFTDWVRLGR
jgi:hypothetical protein